MRITIEGGIAERIADGHQSCRCAQHAPIVGAVTFSGGPGLGWEVPPNVYPSMIEHVHRAVDDYVATLDEIAADAATVIELVQRGDSWHIAITAGELYFESAEPSLEAALACVGRVLGQSVGSCAEVPTGRCGIRNWSDGKSVCGEPRGHEGAHRGNGSCWTGDAGGYWP